MLGPFRTKTVLLIFSIVPSKVRATYRPTD
jgi:hypothetical protein